MRNIWILTRLLLKNGPGNNHQKNSGKKKRGWKMGRIGLYALVGVCLIPMVVLLFLMGRYGYQMLAPFGCEKLMLELVCAAGMLVIFIFGITMFLSYFYLSPDIVRLLPLPFTPVQIVGAKWLCCLFHEYYMVALLLLPILAGYGFGGRLGWTYWLSVALGVLSFPVVPLVYAAVLCMAVMRMLKNIPDKDFLSYFAFAASLVFAIGINLFSQSISKVSAGEIVQLLKGQKGLLDAFHMIFPNLVLLTRGLGQSSLWYVLLFLVTCIAFVFLFLAAAKKLYLPSVLGMSESTGEKRKMSGEEVERSLRRKNPVRTYAAIEWKKLYRTPVFFMNCVLMTLIWPLFLFAILAVSVFSSIHMAAAGGFLKELLADGTLSALLSGETPIGAAALVAAGIALFPTMVCQVSSTALSRQGDSFLTMKCIPMSYEEQIQGMLSGGILIGMVGTLPYGILFNLLAVFLGLHPVTLLYTTAITVLCVLFTNYEQMMIDFLFPKLNWENEAQAVKSNYWPLLSMLIEILAGGALIALGVLSCLRLHWNIHLVILLVLLLFTALTLCMRRILFTCGSRILQKLE